MANMVIVNTGKALLLARALKATPLADMALTVKLYQNNYTPVDASITSNFTAATFTGSTGIAIPADGSGWGAASVVANVGQIDAVTAPSWTNTGTSQTVYGWYLTDDTTGDTIAAQKFDVARVMGTGATETLDPFRIKDKTFV